MTLMTGETMGLPWYEVPMPGANRNYTLLSAKGDQAAPVVTILCGPGGLPHPKRLADIEAKPENQTHQMSGDIGFRPFDEAAVMPGRLVVYDRFATQDRAVETWALAFVADIVPAGLDLSFEYDHYASRLQLCARTLRDGRVVTVRRKVTTARPLREEVVPILAYFARNCPAPTDAAPRHTCGTHLMQILTGLSGHGVDALGRWLDSPVAEMPVATALVPGASGLTALLLKRTRASNAILASAHWSNGIDLKDDDTGTTLTLPVSLPETLLNALRGETVDRIVDAPWARHLRIRTIRCADGTTTVRAAAVGEPLIPPARPADDHAAAAATVRALTQGEEARWRLMEESVRPILAGLDLPALAAVLATLVVQQVVDLAPYGFGGWYLKAFGASIQLSECPTVDLQEYAKARAARATGGNPSTGAE